ncbi:M48 family metallopeptidase [Micromonospora matsumotoense]|uniref:M48 family metallopeptidase n=1 Tax=Micromonospora matsumotoense TaxID=121616 RepID=UPI0033CAD5F1
MKTWLQAVLSVVLFVGFYVFAVGLVVALGAFGMGYGTDWDGSGTREFRPFLVGAAIALFLALVFALGRVIAQRPTPPAGILLSPEQAPELWRIVRDLATRMSTREPDDIRLTAGANAAVTEEARLLGLLPGRRTVILGLPLLPAYTVDQVRAVLAHEMGHFSGRHTRSVRTAHRARMMIVETVRHTTDGVLRAVLSGCARLFVAVMQGISRQMEYEADRYAVAVSGRDAMVTALREIRMLSTGWDEYLERHVLPAYDRGYTCSAGSPRTWPSAARKSASAASRWHPPSRPGGSRIPRSGSGSPHCASCRTCPSPRTAALPPCWCLTSTRQAADSGRVCSIGPTSGCCPGTGSPPPSRTGPPGNWPLRSTRLRHG